MGAKLAWPGTSMPSTSPSAGPRRAPKPRASRAIGALSQAVSTVGVPQPAYQPDAEIVPRRLDTEAGFGRALAFDHTSQRAVTKPVGDAMVRSAQLERPPGQELVQVPCAGGAAQILRRVCDRAPA